MPDAVFCLCVAIEHIVKTPVGILRIRSEKWVHDIPRME